MEKSADLSPGQALEKYKRLRVENLITEEQYKELQGKAVKAMMMHQLGVFSPKSQTNDGASCSAGGQDGESDDDDDDEDWTGDDSADMTRSLLSAAAPAAAAAAAAAVASLGVGTRAASGGRGSETESDNRNDESDDDEGPDDDDFREPKERLRVQNDWVEIVKAFPAKDRAAATRRLKSEALAMDGVEPVFTYTSKVKGRDARVSRSLSYLHTNGRSRSLTPYVCC
jgi:hypothetical protein